MAAPMQEAPKEIVAPSAPVEVEPMDVGMVETKLELFNVPTTATKGDIIAFKGKLTRSDTGKGIPYAVVEINERDRSFFNDEWLADAGTREDGSFSIDWKVRRTDWWDNTAEIYARFYKHITAKPSKTAIYKIVIK
jgi:hypothetical protein